MVPLLVLESLEWDFVRVDIFRCHICLHAVLVFLSPGSDRKIILNI